MLFTYSSASFGLHPRRQLFTSITAQAEEGTHLSAGLTGIFFSTSLPPFSKMKWLRFVLPPSPAPSAVMSTRFGSESKGYGSSFCEVGRAGQCLRRGEESWRRRERRGRGQRRIKGKVHTLVCHLVWAAGLSALRQ